MLSNSIDTAEPSKPVCIYINSEIDGLPLDTFLIYTCKKGAVHRSHAIVTFSLFFSPLFCVYDHNTTNKQPTQLKRMVGTLCTASARPTRCWMSVQLPSILPPNASCTIPIIPRDMNPTLVDCILATVWLHVMFTPRHLILRYVCS